MSLEIIQPVVPGIGRECDRFNLNAVIPIIDLTSIKGNHLGVPVSSMPLFVRIVDVSWIHSWASREVMADVSNFLSIQTDDHIEVGMGKITSIEDQKTCAPRFPPFRFGA